MTDNTAVNSTEHPPTFAIPTVKARPGVVATMIAARLGLMLPLSTVISAALVLKLQSLMPQAEVVPMLGLITSIGAFSALFFDPVFGRISDRTMSRFGRRRPWMILGMTGLLVSLLVMALAPSAMAVGIGWILAQITANAAVAAHTASIADQLPSSQRGKVAGAIGIAQQAATLGAAYAAQLFSSDLLLLFLVPGVIGFILVLFYALLLPDQPRPFPARQGEGWKVVLKTFWVNPIKNPDFGLAWWSRFLVVLANFMFTTFRLLWIQHEMDLEPTEAVQIMATGVLVFTVALVVSGQVAGWLSDKLGRRKVFIVVSALIFVLGTILLTQTTGPTMFYVAEAIIGVGFGAYVAVDLALVLDVLPDPEETAKDLGVFNIAMAGPQVIAPALAAWIIGLSNGANYDAMLMVAAGIALVGALLIVPVRSVR
ncbi:MFS transporter [Pseudoclavibacter sp. RFBJ3]|uniref:MFS transporter n=1 Tax=unclassified Pseudoclavibacter TaxID=2615177 RepID=UPI000CE86DC7|nr:MULTISPECIES: MFS transporter [unclassified Pseudoclavibacter]PPF87527.1 MFS transporter [Pseudoclavibacter sp. RFBJ5]PPF90377.1 MFS transporter [Pseudoclavibacter sp. RFBJ3]PPG01062.1 MFS transporter [Pseudoclavibacter sp. RFBH5]PPG26165.1 MFS transporter [Pseudoclavibacter sp. RFBI4]